MDAPRPLAFAVDCDRTLTGPDLVPDPAALDAVAELRAHGIACILVTGRSRDDLDRFGLGERFDAFALEGGALWGPWNALLCPSNASVVLEAADRLAQAGVDVERRSASFGVAVAALPALRAMATGCSLQVNVDRVDVLPPGLDKGTGLDGALASLGLRGARVVAIGDADNDRPMFDRADVGLAVANALGSLKEHADEVLSVPGPAAVVEAARRLLDGEWRSPPPVPAAAA